ncbi:MAG: nucleotidyltransferase [Abditibacteriales bacterium]|nr:nucleotidyltransferase [Abditibacteriales bacterium]MDW8366788.1 hypothetical protein [Abditibacteriales bacterium]
MASEMVLEIAARAAGLLRQHGFEYALIGGLALQPWGRLRSTLDVDLLVLVPEQAIPSLQEVLWEAGFVSRHAAPVRLAHGGLVQTYVEHAGSG